MIFFLLLIFFFIKNILIIYIVYSQRKIGVETLNWNRLLVFSNYFKSDYEKSTIKIPQTISI